jgi:hypothetical protein
MIVAGVVIETCEGAASRVAARLAGRSGLTIHAGDGSRRLAAVWVGPDGRSLERMGEALLRDDHEVLGVYPTFVADDSES